MDRKSHLADLAVAYRELEDEVRRVVSDACRVLCLECEGDCCKEEICLEANTSPWLRLSRRVSMPSRDWRARGAPGWMSEWGCGLRTGRPPVCYGYFCNHLLGAFDADRQYALRVAGALPMYVGSRAVGDRHLVELDDLDCLTSERCKRLEARVVEGRRILAASEAVLRGAPMDVQTRVLLRKVARQPKPVEPCEAPGAAKRAPTR